MNTKVNNVSSVMEAGDHLKKRGVSENPKSRVNLLIILAIAFGFAFGACSKTDTEPMMAEDLIETSGSVPCVNEGFDPTDSYTTRGNGTDGWNQVQDFIPGGHHTTYNFWLENEEGETFVSFCGGFSSSGLGTVEQNLTLEFEQYADIVGVLNYINNEYGSIDAWSGNQGTITNSDAAANTKLIVQYAIWSILGQTVTSGVPAIDDAVLNALANGKTATGKINIYFMVGVNFPNDIGGVQPQIVPVLNCCPEDYSNIYDGFDQDIIDCVKSSDTFWEVEEAMANCEPFEDVLGLISELAEKCDPGCTQEDIDAAQAKIDAAYAEYEKLVPNKTKYTFASWDTYEKKILALKDLEDLCDFDGILPVKPTPRPVGASYSTITATNAGNVPAILAGLNQKNGNPIWNGIDNKTGLPKDGSTPFVVPNSNHFVFAKMTRAELEEGVKLQFLNGNKYDIVGTGFVQLVGNNIELTINDFVSGSFGLIAFDQLPVTNNGNIHSQKEADLKKLGAVTGFNHDNKKVVPCPVVEDDEDIYLFFHAGSLQFYTDKRE